MDKKNLYKSLLWLAVLLVLLGGAYAFYSMSDKNSNPGGNTYESGENNSGEDSQNSNLSPAHDFELKDLDGNTVKLSDYKGKIVFLNFWASWCPPCRSEMPEFDRANKKFLENGDAIILAVNLTTGARGETEEVARKFINDKKYTLKVLLDKDGSVANKYNFTYIPSTFVINKEGELYTHYEGPITEDTLMNDYNKLK